MKLKTLFILLAAVGIGLAGYFYSSNNKFGASFISSRLIPGLESNMNDVTKFTVIEVKNSLLSSVTKTDNGWVVDNRDGYPANVAAVRQTFALLAEADLVEAKTSNPDNYSRLGVEDVAGEDAQGVLLTVEGLGDAVNVIFGNDGTSGKNTQYVRNQSEEQSWLINKKININRDVTDWLDKDILDIPPERIKSVQITHAQGPVVNINNTGNVAYEFDLDAAAPEGMKISDSEIYQVANALSSLQLRDVSKISENNIKGKTSPVTTVFKTYDGLTITVNGYPSTIEPYFTIDVEFNADDVDENVANKTAEAEGEVSDAAMTSDPKAAEIFANETGPKVEGWAYIFPTITHKSLVKELKDFFIDENA